MKYLLLVFVLYTVNAFGQNDLRYFIGNWNLELINSGNKTNKPDLKAKWTVESGLDSTLCLLGHVTINKKVYTREIITYDPIEYEYIRNITDNNGSYYTFTSKGWNDNKLIWYGRQNAPYGVATIREEITRISAAEFHATYYILNNNNWTEAQHEVLKRINK